MFEIGFNNHGETFWDAITQIPITEIPVAISRLGFTSRPVTVTAEEAEAIERWCESVPGWDERPLIFVEC